MSEREYEFRQRAQLFRWVTASGANLYFVRFTDDVADAIGAIALMRRLEGGRRRGWGSLRVYASIDATSWRTSIFPGDHDTWLLPIKREVRDVEGLAEGDELDVEIKL